MAEPREPNHRRRRTQIFYERESRGETRPARYGETAILIFRNSFSKVEICNDNCRQ